MTGRTRTRLGRETYTAEVLILQVETQRDGEPPAWRDAKVEDVTTTRSCQAEPGASLIQEIGAFRIRCT